jgi:hypothetical protein
MMEPEVKDERRSVSPEGINDIAKENIFLRFAMKLVAMRVS